MALPDRTDDGRRGAPDVIRVGDLEPEEVAALVKKRRRFRKLNALAAVGLALAAGTFLACAERLKPRRPDGGDRDSGGDDTDGGRLDAGMDASVRDAGTPVRDAAIDVGFHRDGMPVPDNLLE
jgi:hypothetical protein